MIIITKCCFHDCWSNFLGTLKNKGDQTNENFMQNPEMAPLKCPFGELVDGLCVFVGCMEAEEFVAKFKNMEKKKKIHGSAKVIPLLWSVD